MLFSHIYSVMLFNSLPFLIFFGAYFSLYLMTPLRYQLLFVIVGSTLFYSYWNPYYVFLPHILTLLSYFGVLWMAGAAASERQWRMLAVVGILLLPLIFIKYTNFLYNEVFSVALGVEKHKFDLPLPLSISFVTFTLISYVIDVYRERYPVERSFSTLSGLVLFFPHLIAGPILRPHELLPQLNKPKSIRRSIKPRVVFGSVFFTLGILKKVIFADSISPSVDVVFSSLDEFSVLDYWFAIYGFGLQIYCDFSGYTDMAIGLALMLGIRLPENFQHPYTSASIVEFWRRWHITLSNWLRDYIYIPLGGNRGHYRKQMINILITMAIGGLWHGASWTFVLWGLMHGAGIAVVHGFRRTKLSVIFNHFPRWVSVFITFNFVMFTWVLFRAPDMVTAQRVVVGAFTAPFGDMSVFLEAHMFQVLLIGFFLLTHRWDDRQLIRRFVAKIPPSMFWLGMVLIWGVALIINEESSKNFIYFDF